MTTTEEPETIPFPKGSFFIVVGQLLLTFYTFGKSSIIPIFYTDKLHIAENDAMMIIHGFPIFGAILSICGGILADSFFGKFNMIAYMSPFCMASSIIMLLSAIPVLNVSPILLFFVAMSLSTFGGGLMGPCIIAFAGDQFLLPEQESQLKRFFSMFYFFGNAGCLISMTIMPIIKARVHCFEEQTCYALSFGICTIFLITGFAIILIGKPLYIFRKPSGNMVTKVSKCIGNAIKVRKKLRKTVKKDHWLDYAEEKYGKDLTESIKIAFRLLILYLPLPVYYALYSQQRSGWTFQARRMNGDIYFTTILPEHMQIINPLLIVIFLPLFEYCIYPLLDKCKILTTPLQRMVCGGFLTGVAFFATASISLAIEAENPILPTTITGQLRIYNNLDCQIEFDIPNLSSQKILIEAMNYYEKIDIPLTGSKTFDIGTFDGSCFKGSNKPETITLKPETSMGFYFLDDTFANFVDSVDKSPIGYPKFRVLSNKAVAVDIYDGYGDYHGQLKDPTVRDDLVPGMYRLKTKDGLDASVQLRLGGVYVILVDVENNKFQELTITEPNSVHMIWQLVPYILITIAEILFAVTFLEFSYAQAPRNMKAVLQAVTLILSALGHGIIIFIQAIFYFGKQSSTFFLYGGLMVLDMIAFAFLARSYKYTDLKEANKEDHAMQNVEPGTSGEN